MEESLIDQVMKLVAQTKDGKNNALIADEIIAAVRDYDFNKHTFIESLTAFKIWDGQELIPDGKNIQIEIVLPGGKLQSYPVKKETYEIIWKGDRYWRYVHIDEPQPEVVKEPQQK